MTNNQPKIEKLITELCPKGVEFKEIQSVCKNITSGGTPSTSRIEYYGGKIPWLRTQEVDWLEIYDASIKITEEGLNNSSAKLIPSNCVIVAMYGATAAKVAINKIPLCTNQACCNLEIDEKQADYKYVFYWLCNEYINLRNLGEGSQSNINGKKVKKFLIPLPPLAVQEEIVKILDNFTELESELESELEAELEARKKQYEHYRDVMLTFGDEVEWKSLGEVAKTYDGTHQTPKYTTTGVPFVSVENIKNIYSTKKCISSADFEKYKYKPKEDDLFMTRIGSIGICAVVENADPLAYYVTLSLIRPDQKQVLTKYLKFIIESGIGKSELYKRTLVNATPIKINLGEIGKIKIPLPPLTEQARIVAILDKFDALVNNISIGLPAELNGRRKQYEYYRDKLLTFKELKK